ncbi:hypothetical protein Hdeb2414_s0002g00047001 [Helianthus debilis subsp. tardiflorus]
MGASMERALKHRFDRQESWNRTHAYAFEQEMNNRYIDDQNRRMHDDWHAGRPVVVDPPPVDYPSLPPYDGCGPPTGSTTWRHTTRRKWEWKRLICFQGIFEDDDFHLWASSVALLLARWCIGF